MLKQIFLWAFALSIVALWALFAIGAIVVAFKRYWGDQTARSVVEPQGPALFMCCEHDEECERRGEPCRDHWQHPDNYRPIDPERIYRRWNNPPRRQHPAAVLAEAARNKPDAV
jgi:hypothetical protein